MNYYFVIVFILLFKSSSLIAVYENEQILEEVHSFLKSKNQNLDYKLNKKIKLPKCFGQIEVKKKYNNLKTLEIECLGEKPWKYNLRTNISEKFNKKSKKNKINKRCTYFSKYKKFKKRTFSNKKRFTGKVLISCWKQQYFYRYK